MDNKLGTQEIINYRNLLAKKYKFFFILIIFIFLSQTLFNATINHSDFILSINNFLHNINFFRIENNRLYELLLKSIFYLLPIPFITLIELLIHKDKSGFSFFKTSLGRIKFSKGYKNADFWYFLTHTITTRIPLLTIFLTLGIASANNSLSLWFNSAYKSYIVLPNTHFLATLIMIFAILIEDFILFFKHYLSHKIPLIWDIHEFHHSATEMTILSGYRVNTLENLLTFPISIPFSVLSGLLINKYLNEGFIMPVLIFLVYRTMQMLFSYVGHTSLKIIYPKFLSRIFLSPSLHWIHHSDNIAHYDKNFGPCLVFWDKMFGTYLDESELTNISDFGVKNSDYNKYHPLYSFNILPIMKVIRRLKFLLGN